MFLVWFECQRIVLPMEGNQPVVSVINCSVAKNLACLYWSFSSFLLFSDLLLFFRPEFTLVFCRSIRLFFNQLSCLDLSRHPWTLLPARYKLVDCIPKNCLPSWLWCLFYLGLIINHVRALVMLLQNCFEKPAQQNVLQILFEDKAFKRHTRNKKTSVQHTGSVSQKSRMDRGESSLRDVQKLEVCIWFWCMDL